MSGCHRTPIRLRASQHSELWLDAALRVIFMSYFIELPSLDEAGLGIVWRELNAVTARLQRVGRLPARRSARIPLVRGGNSALSGTYTTRPKRHS